MVNKINRLSARTVATLTKPGRHADGGGHLTVSKTGSKRWTFMFERGGRQREAGLGGVKACQGREIAAGFREALAAGNDPIAARRDARQAQQRGKTFGECAAELHASKKHGWRSAKHAAQWLATIEQHAKPLYDVPVAHVNTAAVLAVLQPVWQRFPETSSRLRGRIEAVLDYAKAHGLRSGENPAAWRGHLSLILSKHIKAPRHHEAMAYGDVPAFLTCLRMRGSVASIALEFAILTVARGGEVIGARWSEIDADKNVWTAPLPV